MKDVAARPHFDWNIRLPIPRTVKGWALLISAVVGVIALTAGLAQIFRVDLSSSSSSVEQVEAIDLDWGEMIVVLTRFGVRPSDIKEEVKVDALLATPHYLSAARREAPGSATDEAAIVFYINETTHIDELPVEPAEPLLQVGTKSYGATETIPMADSPHHRAYALRYPADGVDISRGFSLVFPAEAGQFDEKSALHWNMPLQYSEEYSSSAVAVGGGSPTVQVPAASGVAVLAVLGGLLAAMWPCLFQLTAYFIPAMAGMSMSDASKAKGLKPRGDVVRVAFFFVLGFTIVYTAAGAIVGYGSQQLSGMDSFFQWQRYLSIGAGVILLGMAFRVAAKARAPLVCKMPIARKASNSGKTSAWESMIVGVAFATGCMTCFGSAVLIGMVLYVGLAGSPLVGATLLFLFSLGMGIPLVIGAMAMARVLPMLFKVEKAIPWMGLGSAILIAGYAVILITGNFMVVSSFFIRLSGLEIG